MKKAERAAIRVSWKYFLMCMAVVLLLLMPAGGAFAADDLLTAYPKLGMPDLRIGINNLKWDDSIHAAEQNYKLSALTDKKSDLSGVGTISECNAEPLEPGKEVFYGMKVKLYELRFYDGRLHRIAVVTKPYQYDKEVFDLVYISSTKRFQAYYKSEPEIKRETVNGLERVTLTWVAEGKGGAAISFITNDSKEKKFLMVYAVIIH